MRLKINLTKATSSYRFKLITKAYKSWLKKGDLAVDIGCGNGIISKLLMDQFAIKLTGCDVKNYMVHNLPFKKIGGNQLPFGENEFDVALLNDVLHHIPFEIQESLIKKAINVAKVVLIFDAEPTVLGKISDVVLNKYHYGDLKVPLSFRSIKDWQKLFKKLNLKSTSKKLKKPIWYPFSHIAFELQKV